MATIARHAAASLSRCTPRCTRFTTPSVRLLPSRRNSLKRATLPLYRAQAVLPPPSLKKTKKKNMNAAQYRPLHQQSCRNNRKGANQNKVHQHNHRNQCRCRNQLPLPLTPALPVGRAQLLPLRSGTLRQRRAFQRANTNVNQGHHHHHHHEQNHHATVPSQTTAEISNSNGERPERLPRRPNYPGYATYRYRDQIARQQEKWDRAAKVANHGDGKQKLVSHQRTGSTSEEESKHAQKPSLTPPGISPGVTGSKCGGKSTKAWSAPPMVVGTSCAKRHGARTRVTGADLYVVRLTRTGALGNAMPCWRCLEWCKWAGVKRIFHYAVDSAVDDVSGSDKRTSGRWICIKVNETRHEDCYWTQGDGRILGGGL